MSIFKTSVPPLDWPKALLFIAAAVACFHVAYIPVSFGPIRLLMLLYLVFLVQLARLRTTRESFYAGLLTGILCTAAQLECFWRIFGAAAIPMWVILALWVAVFVAIIHASLARFGAIWAALIVPFVWTGLEYFRSELYYLKFSWLNIGYAFADWQVFPYHMVGMYGVGFLIALFACWFLVARSIFALSLVIVSLVLVRFVAPVPKTGEEAARLHVAGVQLEAPAEPQIPSVLNRLLAKYPEADLLVLSEYTLDGPVPESVRTWCRLNQRYLIVGGKDPAPNSDFYDTAFVVDPNGEIVFRQAKSVPIQFFRDGLPAPKQAVWNSPWGKIGICICYDLSYTRVTDRLVRMGTQLLIVPTMDVADWGKREHELHALVAPVRAAEYGVPIFRLASSGISQAVSNTGRVLAKASFPGEMETLFVSFQLAPHGSLPLDRLLAPFSVCGTIVLIGILFYSRWARHGQPEAVESDSLADQNSERAGTSVDAISKAE